ncbi:MAG: nodulation protein NfeD, partial [Rhodospirillales bacterium]|nr:nodulation protein NfeD [Rhodospirillales bacterium]
GVDFRVAWPLGAASAVTSAIKFVLVIGIALKVHRRAVVTGSEEMLGLEGRIIDWDGLTGHVRAHGEVWQARAERPLEPGSAVRTVAREGLVLIVEPATTRR